MLGPGLIILVGIIYAAVALIQLITKHDIANAIIFSGYAFSNIGLAIIANNAGK